MANFTSFQSTRHIVILALRELNPRPSMSCELFPSVGFSFYTLLYFFKGLFSQLSKSNCWLSLSLVNTILVWLTLFLETIYLTLQLSPF